MKSVKKLPLTSDCHHWTRIGEVPWDLQKYWQQRHTMFPYYNEGIYLTHDAWYGVTPEPVASQIARDIQATISPSKTIIVDCFAGVGANAISFAQSLKEDGSRRWERVLAVERDAATLACAQHNASLHGVDDVITWILGDSFEFLDLLLKSTRSSGQSQESSSESERLSEDLQIDPSQTMLFASPPWGGPGYSTDEVFDLSGMEPYNLDALHGAYKTMDHALYIPRTSDIRQVAKLAPPDTKIEVVQYCVEGASKAMVCYIPAAAEELGR